MSTNILFKSHDDNEIKITQTGDTLKLYIDQIGFGNKVGGDDGWSLSSMTITGSGLEFDLDFGGNQNILFDQLYLMIRNQIRFYWRLKQNRLEYRLSR